MIGFVDKNQLSMTNLMPRQRGSWTLRAVTALGNTRRMVTLIGNQPMNCDLSE